MQTGRLRRLAEFGNVGAGDERAAAVGQDDRLHSRIGDGALHAIENTAADRGAQRVNRRTVDRDDADHVMTLELDHFVHAALPEFLAGVLVLVNFALRNLIPHLDTEGYFEARPLSTKSALAAGNETSRQESGDRSQLRRRAFPRPRCVARIPSQRRASWQSRDRGPYELAKAYRFAADLHFDQARLPYTRSAVREISVSALGHGARVCRPCESRGPAFVRSLPRGSHARDRRRCRGRRPRPSQHDLLWPEPQRSHARRSTGRRGANSDCDHRDGPRRYLGTAERGACGIIARTPRALWRPLGKDARWNRTGRRNGRATGNCDLGQRAVARRRRDP